MNKTIITFWKLICKILTHIPKISPLRSNLIGRKSNENNTSGVYSSTFFAFLPIYANIREANYRQSKADMLSKFEIALKECSETEGWLQLLFNTNGIDEATYKNYRNLCGRIRRMLIASCKTLKEDLK